LLLVHQCKHLRGFVGLVKWLASYHFLKQLHVVFLLRESRLQNIEKLYPEPDELRFFHLTTNKGAIEIQEYWPCDLCRHTVNIES
jgi:hypothetical protein